MYVKGYTLIEMIFVLMIFNFSVLITIHAIPDTSNLKFDHLVSLIKQTQFDSYVNHEKNIVEIYDSTLYINDQIYDMYPLVCKDEYFYFNKKGNISNALTIHCEGKEKDYELKLQLGTGWMSYEE